MDAIFERKYKETGAKKIKREPNFFESQGKKTQKIWDAFAHPCVRFFPTVVKSAKQKRKRFCKGVKKGRDSVFLKEKKRKNQ